MYAKRRLHPPAGVGRVARPRTWIGFGVIRLRLGVPRLDNFPNPGDAAISTTTAIHRHRMRRYPRAGDRLGTGSPFAATAEHCPQSTGPTARKQKRGPVGPVFVFWRWVAGI